MTNLFTAFIFLLNFSFFFCNIEIKTNLGSIIGFKSKFENHDLDVFYGIPYGEDTSLNRFSKSKLKTKFDNDPFDATTIKFHCPLKNIDRLKNTNISEDCLSLNIWRPGIEKKLKKINIEDNVEGHEKKLFKNKLSFFDQSNTISDNKNICEKKYPVLVYFYGGDGSIFMLDQVSESILQYDGSALAAIGNIIVVTVNYRSNSYGRLYIPNLIDGDTTLYDQALAIEWINKNIDSFCGDNKKITLFGNSFGSISVGLQLLSSQSNQLFKQVIMQSGVPLYNFDFKKSLDETKEKSLKFADNLNCTKTIKKEKIIDLNCLKKLPLEQTLPYLETFVYFSLNGNFISKKTKILFKFFNTLNIPKDKKLLIGVASNENCMTSLLDSNINTKILSDSIIPNVTIEDARKQIYNFAKLIPNINSKEAKKISDFYTSSQRIYNNYYYDALNEISNDFIFNCPIDFFVKKSASIIPNSVFSYVLSKNPKLHHSKVNLNYNWTGVCHADEIPFLFGHTFKLYDNYENSDREFSKELINVFAEFVRNGKPPSLSNGDEWPSNNEFQSKYVNLDLNNKEHKNFDFQKRCSSLKNDLNKNLLKQPIFMVKEKKLSDLNVFYVAFASFFILIAIFIFIEKYLMKKNKTIREGYEKL